MISEMKQPGLFQRSLWAATLLTIVFLFYQPEKALAQWTFNGVHIYNTNSGNVGIGTTSPAVLLDIKGNNVPYGGQIRLQATDYDQITFYNSSAPTLGSAGRKGQIYYDLASNRLELNNDVSGGAIVLQGPGDSGDGGVGIGTQSPRGLFDVAGIGDIYLASNTIGGTGQSLYLPGHIYLAPLAGGNGNVSYLQARRSNDSGSTELQIRTTNNGGVVEAVRINSAGNVGIGTTNPLSLLHVAGSVTVDGNIAAKYQDVAEWVPSSLAIPAGTVVVLDTEQCNHVLASSRAYDTRVAGVVSAKPGVILGEGGAGKVMVATTGRVRVRVDATSSPIRVGDLLVTSDKEGIAMRSQPLDLGGTPIHRPGTLIGKALEPLEKGVGEILVLLSLQ